MLGQHQALKANLSSRFQKMGVMMLDVLKQFVGEGYLSERIYQPAVEADAKDHVTYDQAKIDTAATQSVPKEVAIAAKEDEKKDQIAQAEQEQKPTMLPMLVENCGQAIAVVEGFSKMLASFQEVLKAAGEKQSDELKRLTEAVAGLRDAFTELNKKVSASEPKPEAAPAQEVANPNPDVFPDQGPLEPTAPAPTVPSAVVSEPVA